MWKRDRLAALAVAIMLNIGLPTAILQGYLRYNPYILPLLGLLAALLYLYFVITSHTCIRWRHSLYSRSPMMALIFFIIIGSTVGGILGTLEWLAIHKSQKHVSLLQAEDNAKESLAEDIKTLIDTKSKAELPELGKRFPGGFQMFAVAIGSGAMGGHNIIRGPTSYSIDITWGNAAITELTSNSLTLQLQNIRITRTETTPGGTQPAGEININGAAVWRIDRGTNLVYINNAMAFWGYVLGGYVLLDTNDVLLIAIGLQKIE